MEEFKLESWDEIKTKDFDLLASGDIKKRIFKQLGYSVLESGELFDLTKKEVVKVIGKPDESINLKDFPHVSLISGSHNFVRNIAEYSDLLAEKGELKFASGNSSIKK